MQQSFHNQILFYLVLILDNDLIEKGHQRFRVSMLYA